MKPFRFIFLVGITIFLCSCRSELLPTVTQLAEQPTAPLTPILLTPTVTVTFMPEETATLIATPQSEVSYPTEPTKPFAVTPTNTPRPTFTSTPTATPLPVLPTGNETSIATSWTTIGTPLPIIDVPIAADNVDQLIEVGRWGKGWVIEAAYTPDGSQLFVLTEQGVYLYDAATASQLAFYSHAAHPNHLALSSDGKTLALSMGTYPYYVEIRDARSFAFLGAFFPFSEARKPIAQILFDQSNQNLFVKAGRFVSSAMEVIPIVSAWNVTSFTQVAELEIGTGFAYASQADLVVTNDGEGKLHLWQWSNLSFREQSQIVIPEEMQEGSLLAISPDGQHLALSGSVPNPKIAVWQIGSDEPMYILNSSRRGAGSSHSTDKDALVKPALVSGPGRDFPQQLLFSPDSQRLAVTTGYYDLTIWQVSDGSVIQEFTQVGETVLFHPDGEIAAAWLDGLSQWQIESGTFINVLKQHIGSITDLVLVPHSDQLAIASRDGFIYLRHLRTGELFASLRAAISNETTLSSPSVRSIDVTADGQTLVSASSDAYRVWNLHDYSVTMLSPSPRGDIGAEIIAVSPDGQYIIGKEYDTGTWLWAKGQSDYIDVPFYSPSALSFSPVGLWLATTQFFGEEPKLWNPITHDSLLLPVEQLEGSIEAYCFSSDGRYLAAATSEDSVLIWHVTEDLVSLHFEGAVNSFYTYESTAAFSPDNRLLAQSARQYIRFWDMETGSLLYTLDTTMHVTAMTFSVDGNQLITGHEDGSVRFWAVP